MRARWTALVIVGLATAVLHSCSCGTQRFTPPEAARVCAVLQTCFPNEFNNLLSLWGGSLAACTTNPAAAGAVPSPGTLQEAPLTTNGLNRPLSDIYRCILAANGDCAKAGACWDRVGGGDSCTAETLASSNCNGNILEGCSADGNLFRVDCARYDSTCGQMKIPNPFFDLSYDACILGTCNSSTRLRCRGNQREVCTSDDDTTAGLYLEDCSRLGQRCQEPAGGGNAMCVSDSPCDASSYTNTCSGAVAVTCPAASASEARFDCAASSTLQRCETGACVLTSNECALNYEPTCDGTRVRFCQDGSLELVDCAALGFTGCTSGRCVAN